MHIRDYMPADREELSGMMREFYDSPALIGDVPQHVIDNNLESLSQKCPFLEGYIFENETDITGYSLIAKSYSTEAGGQCIWIEDIYLKDEYRGQGAGTEFFEFIKNKYDGKAVRIRLEAEKDNLRAINFYRKHGYNELGYMQLIMDY